MRSIALSRVGAARTCTQVLAIANSHRPVSGTTTLGGGAGRVAAGLGNALVAAGGVAAPSAVGTVAGARVATDVATGTAATDTARSTVSAASSAVESLGAVNSAI